MMAIDTADSHTAALRGLASALVPATRRTIQRRLELLVDDPELLIALRCQLEDGREPRPLRRIEKIGSVSAQGRRLRGRYLR